MLKPCLFQDFQLVKISSCYQAERSRSLPKDESHKLPKFFRFRPKLFHKNAEQQDSVFLQTLSFSQKF